MRNPERVLNSLVEHSKDASYKFERLYRILFNEQMFYAAYQNIYAKQGNMTKGVDGKTATRMSIARIELLVTSLKDETYQPHPSRRVYIPKKNGKKRPLGIPSFDDKLVQEVIRMILEAIYEGSFERSSHGFRPLRSCHTALTSIQDTFTGARWFIEGDIKGFFDNIDHNILINVLKERIDDERFIRLIRKFLNAGYMESWTFHKTYSGTPQGGIISPILANIYLDKLDKYMKEYSLSFDKGDRRRTTTEYNRNRYVASVMRKNLKNEKDDVKRKELLKGLKAVERQRIDSITNGDAMDENFRRLKYIRYADDFLISIIGSKEECRQVKSDIAKYLNDKLKLELSDEKTLITNAQKPAKFLGYDISIRKSRCSRRNSKGILSRPLNDKIVLTVTFETMRNKLLDYGTVKFKNRDGKEVWEPKTRTKLVNMEMVDILSKFNAEIRGLYNYYSIANNSNFLHSFYHIMRFSMFKTVARKLKTTKRQVLKKYSMSGVFTLPYTNSKGKVKYCSLYNGGFKRKTGVRLTEIDEQPRPYAKFQSSLVDRLKKRKCELCGNPDEVVVHQVRNLKSLKGVFEWELKMINGNRKTLVVCEKCNCKIMQNQTESINGEPYTLRGVRTVRRQVPENLPQ